MKKIFALSLLSLASSAALAGQNYRITVTSEVPACHQRQDTALQGAIADVERQAKAQCPRGNLAHQTVNVSFDGNCQGPLVTAVFICEQFD